MKVQKRDGNLQELDLNKIHAVLTWACEGKNDDALQPIKGVSISQIEMRAQLHFYDGMPTSAIHELLIKASAELISEDYPNYDHVAARLVSFAVRKEAFGNNLPPHLRTVINRNIETGVYSKDIITKYTDDEIDELNALIVHNRDDLFRYAGSEQMRKKYLVQNRKTKKIFESFQFPYIMVAALLFANYPAKKRMQYVKRYYDLTSQHYISLPTPIMAGLRTKVKQFSSCTLIDAGDSLPSINATSAAIVEYASRKAGIGLNIGRLRAQGQPVRGGDAVTTGVIPFAKYFNAALKSCSQGAVRGASATFNYPVWHLEFEHLIELKNERGTEETRLRTVDYCVHLNELFYRRLINKENITFFSPEEVPDLYEAFYGKSVPDFERLYKKYEKDATKTKKTMSAMDVFSKIITERFETGRIYIMNADRMNAQSPFLEPIVMSNLCLEIGLPTQPMGGDKGRIALCTLSAINWGKFSNDMNERDEARLQETCEMAVRGLDALLDYQEYPNQAAQRATMEYRPLGIGIIDFAHWLAKGRLRWGEENTLSAVEEMGEKVAYYLTETSIQLAKEYGSCEKRTRYHDGWMPMDSAAIVASPKKDWTPLREMAKQYGIRNATLQALMPAETSAQISNSTNGIEPPRDMVTIKGSKEGVLPQIVPEYSKLNPHYQTLWTVKASDYLRTISRLQINIDQAISANTSYNPGEGKVSASLLLSDIILAWKYGYKTLYYNNTHDGSGEEEEDCESGACKI